MPNWADGAEFIGQHLQYIPSIYERHTNDPANYETGKVELVLETSSQNDESVDVKGRMSERRLVDRARS